MGFSSNTSVFRQKILVIEAGIRLMIAHRVNSEIRGQRVAQNPVNPRGVYVYEGTMNL